jgi:hypothetical protein
VDGKPYTASCELSRTYASNRTITKTASMSFPRCARCVKATSVHSKALGVGGVVGFILGWAALGLIGDQGSMWYVSCASGLIVWIVVALALAKALERLFGRSFDEDMWRRAKFSSSPVAITKASDSALMPLLNFVFANEDYGETFARLNR